MAERIVWLIPLLPWLAAAWIGLGYMTGSNRGEAGEKKTARIALAGTGGAFLVAAALGIEAVLHGAPGYLPLVPWLESGDYRILISFLLDPLGLAMAALVALVSTLTLRFSVNYMHREAGFQRFFAILCLFAGAMLMIVTAGNAVLAFVGWELAGVSSYLLIGYAFDRTTATANANRAFVTNRFGDAGFIVGIVLSFHLFGGIEWPDIIGRKGIDMLAASVVVGGFTLAALAKSAQVPFAAWISRALEGPTPSSAVFYGSLMVHAGVFLLIRLEPLLVQAPATMIVLVVLGVLTVLYGLLVGLVQTDVKSTLIFSTQAQVGLMFVECGLGWFDLAAWHMGLHASWRAYQFLSSPSYVDMMEGTARPVPGWLARSKTLYTAALQRFWLDPASEALIVRPTQSLARDVQSFDEQAVDRVIGSPDATGMVSSLADWEEKKKADQGAAYGRGILGRPMEFLAEALHWFEERLVLSSGGEGLLKVLSHLGGYLIMVDRLLGQPRYLLLLIVITFVVIL